MSEADPSGRETKSDAARLLLAAARERFAVAATDLLLPDQARLTEWQRLTAAALLARLVRSIEDELRARLAAPFRRRMTALHAALSSAHVADRPADPRARAGAARRRARHHPRPPRRGASLLEGACAGAKARTICSSWSATRDDERRRRGDGAGDRAQPPLRPLPGADHGPGRAARRAPAQAGLDRRRRAAPLYRPAARPSARSTAPIEEAAGALIAGYDEGDEPRGAGDAPRPPPAPRRPARRRRARRGSSATACCPCSSPALAVLLRARPGGGLGGARRSARPRPGAAAARRRRRAATRPPRSCSRSTAAARSFSGAEGDAAAAQLELLRHASTRPSAQRGAAAVAGRIPAYRASVARISTRARSAARGGMSAALEQRTAGHRPGRRRRPAGRGRSAARRAARARRRRRGRHARRAADRRARPARAPARHHHLARRGRRRRRARPRPVGARRARRRRGGARDHRLDRAPGPRRRAPPPPAEREADFLRAAADWTWETDDALRLTALSPGAAAGDRPAARRADRQAAHPPVPLPRERGRRAADPHRARRAAPLRRPDRRAARRPQGPLPALAACR